MAILGVNIDHVATVREARKTNEPDPVWAAALGGNGRRRCDHDSLREDRRHIQDRDFRVLMESVAVPINLELACADDVLKHRLRTTPASSHTRSRTPRRGDYRRRPRCHRLAVQNAGCGQPT